MRLAQWRAAMAVLVCLGSAVPAAQAGLFDDEEARKAIVDLRKRVTAVDDQGKLLAGLSVSAPADRLEESWLDRVKGTAAQISSALGYRG